MNLPIAKNLAMYAVVECAAKGFGFLVTLHLANTLAPRDFGVLGFVWAIYSLFLLVAQAGVATVGEREIARGVLPVSTLTSTIVSFRSLTSLVALLTLVLLSFFLNPAREIRLVLLLQGCSLLLVPFQVHYFFRGRGEVGPLILSQICQSGCWCTLIWLVVKSSGDLMFVPVAYFLGMVAGLLPLLSSYFRRGGSLISHDGNRVSNTLLRPALAMGASALMVQLYYSLDAVMLGLLKGEEAVGIYTAAHKVMMVVLVIPGVILSAYFPSLARGSGDGRTIAAYINSMMRIGLPLGFAGVLAAPWLISFLYGSEYAEAVVPLQVLLGNVSMVFVAMAFAHPVFLLGDHAAYFRIVAAGAVANLILNILLIPSYGLVGASAATLMSESLVMLVGKRSLDRLIRIPAGWMFIISVVPALGALLVAHLVVATTNLQAPWTIIVFTVSYVVLATKITRRKTLKYFLATRER